jgi:hypothetical protein
MPEQPYPFGGTNPATEESASQDDSEQERVPEGA